MLGASGRREPHLDSAIEVAQIEREKVGVQISIKVVKPTFRCAHRIVDSQVCAKRGLFRQETRLPTNWHSVDCRNSLVSHI